MSTEICRHIRTNGERCGSPALHGRTLCYFHINLALRHSLAPRTHPESIPTVLHPLNSEGGSQREPQVAALLPPHGPLALELPPLEDRESVQMAISMVIAAMAQNRIDPKRAGAMLYGLQVASGNVRGLTTAPSRTSIVRETVLDDSGAVIAPDEDSEEEIRYQQLLADCLDEDDEEDEDEEDDDDDEEDEDEDEQDEEDDEDADTSRYC